MKKNLATMAAIIALFATSCKKNDSPATPETTPVRLKKMERSANSYTSFTYNTQGLPAEVRSVEDNMNTLGTFVYDNAKKLTGGTLEDYRLTFSYGKNGIDTINMLNKTNGTLESKVVFTYSNGKVNEMVYNTILNGTLIPGLKTTYEYNAAGDMTVATNYFTMMPGQFIQLEKHRYDYDTRKTPFAASRDLAYILVLNPSAHNVVKEVAYDDKNEITETHHYTYTYNSKDVPASAKERITYPASPEINKTISYTYE